jgi:hypothetical protein
MAKQQSDMQALEAKTIQVSVENTKTESLLAQKQQELVSSHAKIAAYQELALI